jgi:hypothetical protein
MVRNKGLSILRGYKKKATSSRNAFDESVVSVILDRLILNNEKRKYITYKTKTKKVLLTDKGRQWAEHNCRTRAGVIG